MYGLMYGHAVALVTIRSHWDDASFRMVHLLIVLLVVANMTLRAIAGNFQDGIAVGVIKERRRGFDALFLNVNQDRITRRTQHGKVLRSLYGDVTVAFKIHFCGPWWRYKTKQV
ncbi:hypothetical protein BDV32DRAFT_128502 [Aspergillus pseudonomiae]|nr:hypothetical protein BDV32DRAFT_128502 [Aspergillus pseudonomiae]